MLRSIHKSTKVWVPQSCPDRHRSTTSTSMTAITREKRPLGPSCRKSTRSSEFLPCFWHILRLSSSIILSHRYLQMISHSQPYLFCIWLLWSGSKGWPSLWVIAHCGRATEMKFILKFVCVTATWMGAKLTTVIVIASQNFSRIAGCGQGSDTRRMKTS